jgi:hypothetical protein
MKSFGILDALERRRGDRTYARSFDALGLHVPAKAGSLITTKPLVFQNQRKAGVINLRFLSRS